MLRSINTLERISDRHAYPLAPLEGMRPKEIWANGATAAYNTNSFISPALAVPGDPADRFGDKDRTKLLEMGLNCLRKELASQTRKLESGQPADRAAVQGVMRQWLSWPTFVSIRDKAALAKLPAEERAAFTQFWAEVAALLEKAEEKPK